MESTDSDPVWSALHAQRHRIHPQEEHLSQMKQDILEMSDQMESFFSVVSDQIFNLAMQIQRLSSAPSNTSLVPNAPAVPSVSNTSLFFTSSKTQKFSGDSGDCRAFLTQCELHFELQATAHPTERSKIAYLISHVIGRAEASATAEWSCQSLVCNSYSSLTQPLTQIFQHVTSGREAASIDESPTG